MRVVYSLDELIQLGPKNAAVTIGVFDGVHLGHKRIISGVVNRKVEGRARSSFLITFDPHPLTVTHSRMAPPILSTIDERLELFSSFPLDGIFVIKFDEYIAGMDYRYFIEKYLSQALNMKHLVIGYDFRFGKNRKGTPEKLHEEAKKRGFMLKVVPPVTLDGVGISSTQIRNKIIEGDIANALRLLGHPYLVKGMVIGGHGKGREIGFPTANLSVTNPYKLWPSQGVYAVKVGCKGKIYMGMMNIGISPTMKRLREGVREIEVHIFNYEGDLYDEELTVYCHDYLREERVFPSARELVRQLEEDKKNALRILSPEKRGAMS